MRIKARYGIVALALAFAAAYGALASAGDDRRGAQQKHHGPGSTASALRASGHVRGLYPGARKGLHVKLRNRSSRWVIVRAIRADVKNGAPGCSRDNLSTQPKELAYPLVPPRKTRRIGLRIRMWPGAPDACQGVKFPLRFIVRATR